MKIERPTNRRALLLFSIRFVLLAGGLYILFNWLPPSAIADPLNRHTAAMTAFLLRLPHLEPSVSGVILTAHGFSIRIIAECTAIFVAILYFSFVMAYPTALKNKLLGLAAGLPFLFAANLARILFIFLVGLKYRTFFEYAHVYIGQIVMILLVLVAVMTWLRSIAAVEMDDRPLSFLARFIAYSSIPFVFWLYLDQGFVYINLLIVKALLGLFGLQVPIPEKLDLYPHTFNTFHLIAFTSLMMATRSIERSQKAGCILIGLSILCGAHLLFRLNQVLFVDFNIKYAMRPFVALIIINQWILPFGLWLFFARNVLFKREDRFICPICGAEKKGLIEHMKAKHGYELNQKSLHISEKIA
ncbi:exosortase H [uncultured Desulfosarcina sp.]|uniref:exosortase H n=1 Tax=uncultured Desulfosarcina sp. TaxID=218289 RepID=UPI0029C6EAAB|nr:exosortase H [uncultured Desulfosarcina sp.]